MGEVIQVGIQQLLGQIIYSPLKLNKLVKSKNISLVFLALPTTNRSKRNKIIEKLNKYKVVVKTLPSISEIIDGRITVSDIKDDFKDKKVDQALDMLVRHFKELTEEEV